MARISVVVIDPQHDFCGTPSEGAALSVAGADQDMRRLAAFIIKNKSKIDDLHITLDSHQDVHIAHPLFWKNMSTGKHPDPFTRITANDVASKVWTTTKPSLSRYGERYVEALDRGGRYPLVIWPPHCLIGTPGQAIYEPMRQAVREYCAQFATVNFVTKGSNLFTEHYSAIRAEVDPTAIWSELNPSGHHETDPGVLMNTRFLETVNRSDKVLVAGEALSHCVANTFRDAVNYFPGDTFAKKLVLLKDASSSVTGFDGLADGFINDMVARGMEIATTDSFVF